MLAYRLAAFAVRHRRRRGFSSAPSIQRGVPLGAGDHGKFNGEDATAGDLAIGELSPVKRRPLFQFH